MLGFKVDKVSPEFGGEQALRDRSRRTVKGNPVVIMGEGEEAIKRLEAGEGTHFRIYWGDGEFVCSGKSLDNDSEDAFAPLDYYAEGEFGAVEIRYRNGRGAYEVL